MGYPWRHRCCTFGRFSIETTFRFDGGRPQRRVRRSWNVKHRERNRDATWPVSIMTRAIFHAMNEWTRKLLDEGRYRPRKKEKHPSRRRFTVTQGCPLAAFSRGAPIKKDASFPFLVGNLRYARGQHGRKTFTN